MFPHSSAYLLLCRHPQPLHCTDQYRPESCISDQTCPLKQDRGDPCTTSRSYTDPQLRPRSPNKHGAHRTTGCGQRSESGFLNPHQASTEPLESRLDKFSENHTLSGKTRRSCNSQVFSSVVIIPWFVAELLISTVASRSLTKAVSTSMWEFGQSSTGVCLRSSANRSGYLQILWIG